MSLATPRKGYKSVPWLFGKEIEIPEEWELEQLSETGDLINGLNKEKEDYGHGCLHVNINNIFESFSIIPEKLGRVNATQKEIDTYALQKGDICILRSSVKREGVGYPSLFENNHTSIVFSGFIIRCRPHTIWNSTYLTFLLRSVFMRNIVVSKSSSSANTNINQKSLGSIQMIIPSLPEQQKIASILSNVDNLIESTEKVITHSKKVKTGLMQKLLTRGIGHTKFKKVPWLFGKEIEIPEEWEIKNIKDIFKLKSGSTPARTNPELFTGNIPWVTSTDLNRSTITSTIEKITEEAVTSSHLTIFSKGTFFIATYGLEASKTRGKCGIIEMDSTCNQACMAFLPSEKMIAMFLFYFYLHFGEKIVFSIAQGTKQQNLYSYTVGSVRLLLPPISEQQKIATILSNMDSKITSQEQYKEKLERLKKSLMQKLLTGEVRV